MGEVSDRYRQLWEGSFERLDAVVDELKPGETWTHQAIEEQQR